MCTKHVSLGSRSSGVPEGWNSFITCDNFSFGEDSQKIDGPSARIFFHFQAHINGKWQWAHSLYNTLGAYLFPNEYSAYVMICYLGVCMCVSVCKLAKTARVQFELPSPWFTWIVCFDLLTSTAKWTLKTHMKNQTILLNKINLWIEFS